MWQGGEVSFLQLIGDLPDGITIQMKSWVPTLWLKSKHFQVLQPRTQVSIHILEFVEDN